MNGKAQRVKHLFVSHPVRMAAPVRLLECAPALLIIWDTDVKSCPVTLRVSMAFVAEAMKLGWESATAPVAGKERGAMNLYVSQDVKMEGPVRPRDTASVHLGGEDKCVKSPFAYLLAKTMVFATLEEMTTPLQYVPVPMSGLESIAKYLYVNQNVSTVFVWDHRSVPVILVTMVTSVKMVNVILYVSMETVSAATTVHAMSTTVVHSVIKHCASPKDA